MKRRLYIVVLLAAVVLSGVAQNVGNAMYIFRIDGQVNGFLPDEIESIEYSYFDDEGYEYNEIVTQIINTADSIYKIPLAEIDSVSFITPKTVYKAGVINLSDQLLPYIDSCDGLNIHFKNSTPSNILPQVGDKLVSLEMNNLFPVGFAGEVKSMSANRIECIKVSLEEIFESYSSVISTYGYQKGNSARTYSNTRAVSSFGNMDFQLGTFNWSKSQELCKNLFGDDKLAMKYESQLSIGITPSFHVITTLIVGRTAGTYLSACVTGDITLHETISHSGRIEWSDDFLDKEWVKVPIAPLTYFYIKPGLFYKASVTASISAVWSQRFTWGASFDYSSENKNNIKPAIGGKLISTSFDVEGTLDGSVAVGAFMEVGLSFISSDIDNVCVRGEFGAELVGHTVLTNDDLSNANRNVEVYERLKNSDVIANVFVSSFIQVECGSLGVSSSLPWNLSYSINKWGLVPTFSNINISRSKDLLNTYTLTADVSNDLLMPVSVGFGKFDKEGKLLESRFCNNFYRVKDRWEDKQLSQTFEGISPGRKCICSPMVIFLGRELCASPSVIVGVDLNIETRDVINITDKSADLYGRIITEDLKGSSVYKYGICYTEKGSSDGWIYVPSTMNEYGIFMVPVSSLNPKTEYTYCAYVEIGEDEYLYGDEITFRTEDSKDNNNVIVETLNVKKFAPVDFVVEGRVIYLSEEAKAFDSYEYGISYKEKGSSEKWIDVKSYPRPGQEWIQAYIPLKKNTEYIYRAYVKSGENYIFGEEKTYYTGDYHTPVAITGQVVGKNKSSFIVECTFKYLWDMVNYTYRDHAEAAEQYGLDKYMYHKSVSCGVSCDVELTTEHSGYKGGLSTVLYQNDLNIINIEGIPQQITIDLSEIIHGEKVKECKITYYAWIRTIHTENEKIDNFHHIDAGYVWSGDEKVYYFTN